MGIGVKSDDPKKQSPGLEWDSSPMEEVVLYGRWRKEHPSGCKNEAESALATTVESLGYSLPPGWQRLVDHQERDDES